MKCRGRNWRWKKNAVVKRREGVLLNMHGCEKTNPFFFYGAKNFWFEMFENVKKERKKCSLKTLRRDFTLVDFFLLFFERTNSSRSVPQITWSVRNVVSFFSFFFFQQSYVPCWRLHKSKKLPSIDELLIFVVESDMCSV